MALDLLLRRLLIHSGGIQLSATAADLIGHPARLHRGAGLLCFFIPNEHKFLLYCGDVSGSLNDLEATNFDLSQSSIVAGGIQNRHICSKI